MNSKKDVQVYLRCGCLCKMFRLPFKCEEKDFYYFLLCCLSVEKNNIKVTSKVSSYLWVIQVGKEMTNTMHHLLYISCINLSAPPTPRTSFLLHQSLSSSVKEKNYKQFGVVGKSFHVSKLFLLLTLSLPVLASVLFLVILLVFFRPHPHLPNVRPRQRNRPSLPFSCPRNGLLVHALQLCSLLSLYSLSSSFPPRPRPRTSRVHKVSGPPVKSLQDTLT